MKPDISVSVFDKSPAWQLGYDAYYDLKSYEDNPYDETTSASADWEQGFTQADSDADVE